GTPSTSSSSPPSGGTAAGRACCPTCTWAPATPRPAVSSCSARRSRASPTRCWPGRPAGSANWPSRTTAGRCTSAPNWSSRSPSTASSAAPATPAASPSASPASSATAPTSPPPKPTRSKRCALCPRGDSAGGAGSGFLFGGGFLLRFRVGGAAAGRRAGPHPGRGRARGAGQGGAAGAGHGPPLGPPHGAFGPSLGAAFGLAFGSPLGPCAGAARVLPAHRACGRPALRPREPAAAGPLGGLRAALHQLGRDEVVASRDELLHPDLRPDQRPPVRELPAHGPLVAARGLVVAPPRPGRAGTRHPDRADDQQGGDEQADEPGPDLALQQRDDGEHEVDDEERGVQRRQRPRRAGVEPEVLVAERMQAEQQQARHGDGDEDRVYRRP